VSTAVVRCLKIRKYRKCSFAVYAVDGHTKEKNSLSFYSEGVYFLLLALAS